MRIGMMLAFFAGMATGAAELPDYAAFIAGFVAFIGGHALSSKIDEIARRIDS